MRRGQSPCCRRRGKPIKCLSPGGEGWGWVWKGSTIWCNQCRCNHCSGAPCSTRPVLGTNRFVEAEESKRKVMGGILCFEASSPQTQQSAEPGQSPTTSGGNLISFWWQKKRFSKIIHFIIWNLCSIYTPMTRSACFLVNEFGVIPLLYPFPNMFQGPLGKANDSSKNLTVENKDSPGGQYGGRLWCVPSSPQAPEQTLLASIWYVLHQLWASGHGGRNSREFPALTDQWSGFPQFRKMRIGKSPTHTYWSRIWFLGGKRSRCARTPG